MKASFSFLWPPRVILINSTALTFSAIDKALQYLFIWYGRG